MSEEWVEVRDEPRHRRRFENPYVRVYDVLVTPGDTTLYHRHTEDTLYVAVADARIADQQLGRDEPRPGAVSVGLSLCRPHRTKPLTHQVSNVGDTDMRMIGAEVKASPFASPDTPLDAPGHSLVWETDRLRAYELVLGPGEGTGSVRYQFAGLTIALTVGCLSIDGSGGPVTGSWAPGDAVWHGEAREVEITNVGEHDYRAVVTEWR
jgi:hypothetical protein